VKDIAEQVLLPLCHKLSKALLHNYGPIAPSSIRPAHIREIYFCHLPVSRTPYIDLFAFPVLPFRYLSSGHYKNENFLKNTVRYLSTGHYEKQF
jgi:hypothetical protein